MPSAWLDSAKPAILAKDLRWLQRAARSDMPVEGSGEPVLVMLRATSDPLLADLIAHGEAGVRVYVLVPDGWHPGAFGEKLLKCPRVLIRRVLEVPVVGILKASNARIWLGDHAGEPPPWRFRLSEDQAQALRQVFLRLFWHEAIEEAWTGGQKFAFRPAGERPFDVLEAPSEALVRLAAPERGLDADLNGALVHWVSGPPPDATPRRLWISASGDHHDRLTLKAHEGAEILWDDVLGLPDVAVSGAEGVVLLRGTRARLRLVLTVEQSKEVARLLDGPARWTFRVDVPLGEGAQAGGLIWLANDKKADYPKKEHRATLPSVQARSLRAVPNAEPDEWPAPPPLALCVRYAWTVNPPKVPDAAQEDSLIGLWRKFDEAWQERLSKVEQEFSTIQDTRERLLKTFPSLAGEMMGFRRKTDELLGTEAALKAQPPSAKGPSAVSSLCGQLARLEEAAHKLRSDLKDTEQRAIENKAREEQTREWKRGVAEAHSELPKREEALKVAEARSLELQEKLKEIEEEAVDADLSEAKNIKARKNKLSDDLVRSEKKRKHLLGEIQSLKARIDSKFEFKSPPLPSANKALGGTRFVPVIESRSEAPASPKEALPEVGGLRSHRNQRYLVIERWEDLEMGEREAARLNGQLVVREDI